ncbi:MAG: WYL domain-containing transcriptional regulator [Eubacteriaceae bacterium]|nr:WYL domain-containing transcriptional regulator [Eubacteriaceae bacterium]
MSVSTTKIKTLYILKALLEKSDEEHLLSAADLTHILNQQGLSADRKTIYSDIETLRDFGYDIEQVVGTSKPGYYMASRDFELPELKLLVDAVQASKFITTKKSRELIGKLEKLTSEANAKKLNRSVFILNRPKTGNETIYYNVDQIHEAILTNKQIVFQYTEWNMDKELVPKKNGEFYETSPWALTWDDENYYLIGFDSLSEKIKHYRVDKMKKTHVSQKERQGKEQFEDFDLASFAKKTFGMFGGKDEKVSLVCDKNLVGVMLDRFSRDTILTPVGEDRFKITALVSVSPQFFGWIAGLGTGIYIEGPENVKKDFRKFLDDIIRKYE